MTLKVFEAFSGIGAQRTALANLGIDHEVVAISVTTPPQRGRIYSQEGICPALNTVTGGGGWNQRC